MNVQTQADPDVREILATIGDFSLSTDTLEQLRPPAERRRCAR